MKNNLIYFSILDNLSSDNFEERQKAILSAISINSGLMYSKVEKMLDSEDAVIRNAAMEVMTGWGTKVLPLLIKRAKHSDSNQRLYSANIIGDIKSVEALDAMLELLTDAESNVRFAAAEAIGKIGSKQATMPLLHYLHSRNNDPWEQFPLILTLGQLADERAVIPLLQLAENELLQQPVLQAVGNIADEHAIPYILDILKTFDESLQYMAILAIKNIKDKADKYKIGQETLKILISEQFSKIPVPDINSIISNLEKCINNSDYSIKIGSIFLLGLIDNKRCVDILIEHYLFDLEPEIESALLYLGKKHYSIFINYLQNDELSCCEVIVKILGKLKISKATPYLIKLLDSSSKDIQLEVINALGGIKDNSYIDILIKYLDKSSFDVKSAIVNVLQTYERDTILPYLDFEASDLSKENKFFVIKILTNLVPVINLQSLLKFSQSEDFNIRRLVASALKNYAGEESLNTLIKLLNDSHHQVREESVRSLEQRNEKNISDILITKINDSSAWVRYCIAKALSKQNIKHKNNRNENIIESMRVLINDPVPFVQISAIESIGELNITELSDKIFELINSSDPDISQSAIIALNNFNLTDLEKNKFEELLKQQMFNHDWIIRKATAKAFGKKYNNNYNLLIEMIKNEDEIIVINEILNSLGQISSYKNIIPFLVNMTVNDVLRESAINTLISLGKDIIPYFHDYLDSDNNEIKSNIIFILSKINDDSSINLLIQLSSNSVSPNIRKQAIISLGNFKHEQRASWAIMWAANHDIDSLVVHTAKLILVS